jgi:hypothetical protein
MNMNDDKNDGPPPAEPAIDDETEVGEPQEQQGGARFSILSDHRDRQYRPWHRRGPRVWLPAIGVAAALIAAVLVNVIPPGSDRGSASAASLVAPSVTNPAPGVGNPPGLAAALSQLPTPPQETASLTSNGVSVSVSGVSLSPMYLATAVTGQEEQAVTNQWARSNGSAANATPPSSVTSQQRSDDIAIGASVVAQATTTAIPHALASAVLRSMLVQSAQQQGATVPVSTAETFAQKEEQTYEAGVAGGTAPALPNGETLREAFQSTAAIDAYQQILTVNKEEQIIGGPPVVNSVPENRTPALATWMADSLSSANVRISGVPGLLPTQLPTELPSGM